MLTRARLRILAALVISADPVFTYLAVQRGAGEANPVWASIIASYGIGAAMTIRLLVGLVLVAAVVVAIEHEGLPLTGWVLKVLIVAFSLVAVWNLIAWITA